MKWNEESLDFNCYTFSLGGTFLKMAPPPAWFNFLRLDSCTAVRTGGTPQPPFLSVRDHHSNCGAIDRLTGDRSL